jgi:cardiolipin synthase
LIVLTLREAVPLWMVLVLIARDLLLAVVTIALTRKGQPPLKVTFLGKAATFNLLYAFPLLLLALSDSMAGTLAFIFGWAFAIWGTVLYIFTGASYFLLALRTIRVPSAHRIIEM